MNSQGAGDEFGKFLKRSDVRTRLRQEFPKPKLSKASELLAPPQSRRYGLIGTAFDYLLRFHIQRLNPKAVHRLWIAEAAVSRLGLRATASQRHRPCEVTLMIERLALRWRGPYPGCRHHPETTALDAASKHRALPRYRVHVQGAWCMGVARGVQLDYIRPGKPNENGMIG